MIEIHLKARQSGRLHEWYKSIAELLAKGTVDVGGCRLETARLHANQLKKQFDIDVSYEELHSTTPLHVVFDINDPSPEPGIIGFAGGEKRPWGVRFTLIQDTSPSPTAAPPLEDPSGSESDPPH